MEHPLPMSSCSATSIEQTKLHNGAVQLNDMKSPFFQSSTRTIISRENYGSSFLLELTLAPSP